MIDQFIRHQQYRGLSSKTIERRRSTLGQLAEFLHPLGLERATREHLEVFLGAKRAARTKHAYRSDLRVFYAWAVSHELMDQDPARMLESIRVPKGLPRPLNTDTAQTMLWHGSLRTRRMVALALYAGLRSFEIAGLDCEDVWRHGDRPQVVVRNGKGSKDRVVPMHPTLTEILTGIPSSGCLFPSPVANRPLRAKSVARAIQRHMEISGIEGTPHQLRHTFLTGIAAASNGNLMLTAEMAGHESMNTTLGYVRLAHSGGADVVARIYQPAVA